MKYRMENIEKGIFLSEIKNRFRCLVDLHGEKVVCYVPSSCRLSNFINLIGNTVLLQRMESAGKMEYALFAAETRQGRILLNLGLANAVVADQLRRRYFSFLGHRKNIQRECTIEGYRSDIFVVNTKTIIEIKTVLSLEKIARFPTVPSVRSLNQLEQLEKLLESGYQICYLFVSLGSQVRKLYIDNDEKFGMEFRKCVAKGMMYYGCTLKMDQENISIAASMDICFAHLDR